MKPDIHLARQLRLPFRLAILLLLAWLMLLTLQHGVACAQEASPPIPKRVLLIWDYAQGGAGRSIFDQSFQSVFHSVPPGSIELYSESLETYRFPGESHSLLMRDYLRQKYAGVKIDVIVVVLDSALEFLLRHRDELFPGAPIVYWVNNRPAPNTQLTAATGLWGAVKIRDSLDIALRLQPATEQVFVISGKLGNNNLGETELREQLKEFENRATIHYLMDLPLEELTARVNHLPERSIVLCPRQIIGVGGRSIPPVEAAALIAQSSNAPVYGTVETWVGRGVVGGKVVSLERTGAELAKIALRIVHGERPEEIPVAEVPAVPTFDWRQLRRFHISEDRLPSGSVVRFKELTFWEQYRWHIAGVLSLCAVEALLIAVLLIERRRRRRANASLDRLNAELEERIAERTSALAAKTRELEAFAYTVAHDLKSPLRGIEGYSRLLLEDHTDKLGEDGRGLLHTIRSTTNEMSQLIDDLLAYSRLERQEMACRQVELRPLIESLVEKKRNELGGRKINFILNVNGGTVVADVNGLAQAFGNYLDNAVKFTCEASEPRIEVGTEETENDCRLWVRDNGVGFDMKYHDKIFEIFTRLHPGEEYAGTGIGLAIVRKAVERMKGHVWAESSPGMGATFYLEIPKGCGPVK